MIFEYEYVETPEEVRQHAKNCESRHMQQMAFSTFHDALTQICFGCMRVRSNIMRPVEMAKERGESCDLALRSPEYRKVWLP